MDKIFCPACGAEMVHQQELWGQYRFHDIYYGCTSCNRCWETKGEKYDNFRVKYYGVLSVVLERRRQEIAAEKRCEEKRKAELQSDSCPTCQKQLEIMKPLFSHSGKCWFGCRSCNIVFEQTHNSVSGQVLDRRRCGSYGDYLNRLARSERKKEEE